MEKVRSANSGRMGRIIAAPTICTNTILRMVTRRLSKREKSNLRGLFKMIP